MKTAEHNRKAMEADSQFQAFIASQPKERPCDEHPDTILALSPEATWNEYRLQPEYSREHCRPVYLPCPKCREAKTRQRLANGGVPDVLLDCTLDNWTPGDAHEQRHLAAVREFAFIRKGFLVLLGPVGVGKSHLAVGVMRTFAKGDMIFVKQSSLLRLLRATYSDKNAPDPIEPCQNASLLVLDEMGLSAGGRDEWPMLSEILDHRYGWMKPTIITSNLPWDDLRSELGDRIGDRMREAAHSVLVFSGESHRPAHREAYFATVPQLAQPKLTQRKRPYVPNI